MGARRGSATISRLGREQHGLRPGMHSLRRWRPTGITSVLLSTHSSYPQGRNPGKSGCSHAEQVRHRGAVRRYFDRAPPSTEAAKEEE